MGTHMEIDIVCIQEAHHAQSLDQYARGYRFISAAEKSTHGLMNEKGIGGVAIMVRKEWRHSVIDIHRYSRRCVNITLQTGVRQKNLHIANTYDPHMSYTKGERNGYWKEANPVLS